MEGKGYDDFQVVERQFINTVVPGHPIVLMHSTDARLVPRKTPVEYGVHLHHLPHKHVKRLWAKIAPIRHSYIFAQLRILHIVLALLFVALTVVVSALLLNYSFNSSTGQCLESNPISIYIIIILLLMYISEELFYYIKFDVYLRDLLLWRNKTRWQWRALEGAFIAGFVGAISCSLDLLTMLAIVLFFTGGIVNPLDLQQYEAKETSSRALIDHYQRTNNQKYLQIVALKIHTAKDYGNHVFNIFIPVFPPVVAVILKFFESPTVLGSIVSQWIFMVYLFGIIQMVGVIIIMFSVRTHKNDHTLYKKFLYADMAMALLLFLCKVGMFMAYVIITRLV